MAFCPNCGAQVEGAVCGSCGKTVAEAAPAASAAAQTGLQDNVAGALCYLLGVITGVLFLVLAPYNQKREIRFHAFQAIFFTVGIVAVYVVLAIVGTVLGTVVPVIGSIMVGLVYLVVWLGSVVLWLVLMFKTYNGSKLVLPVVGPMAEKQAG